MFLKSLVTNQLNKSNQKDMIWYAKKYLPNKYMKRAAKFFYCKIDMCPNNFFINILYR